MPGEKKLMFLGIEDLGFLVVFGFPGVVAIKECERLTPKNIVPRIRKFSREDK